MGSLVILFLKKQLRNCKSGDYYSILSIKNGNDNVPIEDNCTKVQKLKKFSISTHCNYETIDLIKKYIEQKL
jgi:hypothetical protein